jgi:hypothetical protein
LAYVINAAPVRVQEPPPAVRERIAELTKRLRSEHDEYERAAQSWTPEAAEKKRDARKAREGTLHEIEQLLARDGADEASAHLARLPFARKLAELEAWAQPRPATQEKRSVPAEPRRASSRAPLQAFTSSGPREKDPVSEIVSVSAVIAAVRVPEPEQQQEPEPQPVQTQAADPEPEPLTERRQEQLPEPPVATQPESAPLRAAERAIDSALASATLSVAEPVSDMTSVSGSVAAASAPIALATEGDRIGEVVSPEPSAPPPVARPSLRVRLPALHLATHGQARAFAKATTKTIGAAAALLVLVLAVVGWRNAHRGATEIIDETSTLPDRTETMVARFASAGAQVELPACPAAADAPLCPCAERPAGRAPVKRAVSAPPRAAQPKPTRLTWPTAAHGSRQLPAAIAEPD